MFRLSGDFSLLSRPLSVSPSSLHVSVSPSPTRVTESKGSRGSSEHSWEPVMSADTTAHGYWLNWRFLLCAIWVLTSTVVSAILIWKYEGSKKSKTGRRDNWRDTVGSLNKDETWGTSLKVVRPAWLLAYRVKAFIMILMLLITNVVLDGDGIFYFYTQLMLVCIHLMLFSSLVM
ncbi:uncharacterized protein LOC130781602 isoform X2 [Actinidia eriantha]|uniref:uncharacterized protein LOC130781602 isoform X2 n=1 Tax=Actinidia eriantha TaxID=165200 RepID=UPI002589F51C|nr:uncharacterized protein LOC130781602 isoform X2 [Actinidia eriantha]